MKILVINCGSSSIKAELIDTKSKKTESHLAAERINDKPQISLNGKHIDCNESGHEAVLKILFKLFKNEKINGVGHRVVHGGDIYDRATLINDAVIEDIEQLSSLAPLHNPMNLLGIREAIKAFPKLVQVAVFDTSFHQTIPRRARTYALPEDLRKKHKLRRFGFHGTSHKYVAKLAAAELKQNWRELRLITCHLGNGASVSAVEYGRSVETSMGMTPLEGLVMGTRAGDIDAGLILHLMRHENMSADDVDRLLNKESGLKGLSGIGNDMRDIIEKASTGDEACRMALQVFTHRIRKYIGAYASTLKRNIGRRIMAGYVLNSHFDWQSPWLICLYPLLNTTNKLYSFFFF